MPDNTAITKKKQPKVRTVLSKDIRAAIDSVVEYNFDDERHDFQVQTDERENTKGHIFHDLVTLRNLLDPKTPNRAVHYLIRHPHVGTGKCGTCGHYGDDCTGEPLPRK